MKITQFIEEIYKKNSANKQSKNYNLCARYAVRTEFVVKATIGMYAIIVIFDFAFIAITYYNTRNIEQLLVVRFPGIDTASIYGLLFSVGFFILLIICSSLTTIVFDSMLFIIFANITLASSIITVEIDELRDYLKDPKRTRTNIKRRLSNIIYMQLKYNE